MNLNLWCHSFIDANSSLRAFIGLIFVFNPANIITCLSNIFHSDTQTWLLMTYMKPPLPSCAKEFSDKSAHDNPILETLKALFRQSIIFIVHAVDTVAVKLSEGEQIYAMSHD